MEPQSPSFPRQLKDNDFGQSPTTFDSSIATDDGRRDTEQGVVASGSCREENRGDPLKTRVFVNSPGSLESAGSYHFVTFTVNITLAIPGEERDNSNLAAGKGKNKKGIIDAPKPQSFYHIEFCLFPEHSETSKVDVVMFGPAAKVYMDSEAKVIYPWYEGNQTWLTWSHSFDRKVNRNFILKLTSHKITFRVWDLKEKLSGRAKSDRPKTFRLPQLKSEDDPESAGFMIQQQRNWYEKSQPKASFVDWKQKGISVSDGPLRLEKVMSMRGQALTLEADDVLPQNGDPRMKASKRDAMTVDGLQQPDLVIGADDRQNRVRGKNPSKSKQKPEELGEAAELARRNGTAVEVDPIPLLAGELSVTDRLSPTPFVLDGYFTISLDQPLFSEELKQDLKPLVIRIESATGLPASPIPIHHLQQLCLPVYCHYKILHLADHCTRGRDHGTHVYFRDINVALTGLLSVVEFQEYLTGKGLEIEVHDRDRRVTKLKRKPALFGTEPEDLKLSNAGLVCSKDTIHNPFTNKDKVFDPYGVALIDLSDLLRGERIINVSVPILSSPPPDPTGCQASGWDRRIAGHAGSVDGPQDPPLPAGHYVDSCSQLKVSIEIACPLTQASLAAPLAASDWLFGRMICILAPENNVLLNKVMSEVMKINAVALNLNLPTHLLNAAISSHKLKDDSHELDIITGFHVHDGEVHLLVLEGLQKRGMQILWKAFPPRSEIPELHRLDVFYNSQLSFQKRLYTSLGVGLFHVHLHKPLSELTRQPLFYVRDMVPQACFHAVLRLDVICQMKTLRDTLRKDLFPTAEMIMSLGEELGIPPGQAIVVSSKATIPTPSSDHIPAQVKSTSKYPPLDNHNWDYIVMKQNCLQKSQERDFIQGNIDLLNQASQRIQRPKVRMITALPPAGKAAYNYSGQALNSTELSKQLLRREMAKAPKRLFTYNQEYMSATVLPVDLEKDAKEKEARSKACWRTAEGFTYPGFKSSIESNRHHKIPDTARLDELEKPWLENLLHANVLQPTLSRGRWTWSRRAEDFELYKKPNAFFSPKAPVTVFLAGDSLQEEQLQAAQRQYQNWQQKVVVTGDMKFSRHSHESLEDKRPMPSLGPVQKSLLEKPTRQLGFAPGAAEHHSLSWDANAIHRHDTEHMKFQELRGADFLPYYKEHTFRYKRATKLLTDEERNVFLFQQHLPAAIELFTSEPPRNVMELKTHSWPLLHIV
ncbi:uncharacterized protein cfap92 isoform X2 [Polypterus senegalus]|uniref:uncharacterized protein cfap92 isoform X2 n=1 Tax=Polypterus senegalus TaxID=55291 RepID=UPI0019641365|nr:uncharacterized protein cfap92 isoform X2 [Polypterus senegalus]